MIGKMYRPLKILNIPGKRGFSFLNKYVSNFGGSHKFEMEIYLYYNADNQTEVVRIDFKDLIIPVYMETGHVLSDGTVISTLEKRYIESLRKMVRPKKISSKDGLNFIVPIESPKHEDENDVLEVILKPVVMNNQEYMELKVECRTPVVVYSQTALKVGE
jgi:hypothetical protein